MNIISAASSSVALLDLAVLDLHDKVVQEDGQDVEERDLRDGGDDDDDEKEQNDFRGQDFFASTDDVGEEPTLGSRVHHQDQD